MAVVIKNSNVTDVTASGIWVNIEENIIEVEDDKTGIQQLDLADIFRLLKGKEIKLKITTKESAVNN